MRVVIDTNIIISRALLPASTAGHALAKALREATILASIETLRELEAVLRRPKFDRIAPLHEP